jgi:hypothetical protein
LKSKLDTLVSYILVLLGYELQLEKAVLLMLLHNS